MSKALVISGANFSANKVTTVTFGDEIPCTGIEISPTTLALTSIGSTQQITVTLTPADTTDAVYYESSNTDVVTVSDAGLITSVGVGSATVTVTCGTQTASCAVTSTHVVDADETYVTENGEYVGVPDFAAGKDYIARSANARGRLYYSTTEYGEYRVFTNVTNAGKYAIPLPKGTSKITINPPAELRINTRAALANVNAKQTYIGGADGQCAQAVAGLSVPYGTAHPYEWDISSYTAANGFVLSVYADTGVDASTITGHTTLTFS